VSRSKITAVVLASVAALAWASAGRAESSASLVARDLPLRGTTAARFDLLGLHWLGSGTLRFRTRLVGGRWSAWRTADPSDGGPTGRWHFSEPYWTGSSNRLQWQAAGRVTRVRAYYVGSSYAAVPPRHVEIAGSPQVIMRRAWNADEAIRRAPPRYAAAIHFAVIHHTAGTNLYTAAESPAIVKGIELYHVEGNGWNDIGYNFLVDRYGQVFEGRYGGITKNVVGAHAGGFNTGSVGVAVLGNYMSKRISPAARAALVRLLAWRLDLAHVDPLSSLTWRSGGNEEFPAGTPVTLRAIAGHRDTGYTDCPGKAFYAQIPGIAQSVAASGLPKLYDPLVTGRLGGLVRFSGRLTSPQAWTVSVRDADGAPVASGSGTGSVIAWTWDARGVGGSSYTWAMEAGSTVRVATGTIGKAPPIVPPQPLPAVLTDFTATPPVISPDGDGYADALAVTYRLRRSALVTAKVLDATGFAVSTLFYEQRQSARVQSWQWAGDSVPDGRYTLAVTAEGGDGKAVTAKAALIVDRTLGFLQAQPAVFSPNGDGRLDTITFAFDVGTSSTVTVNVVQNGRVIAMIYAGVLDPGSHQFVWNGQTPSGTVPDGQYDLVVSAVDSLTTVTQSARFTVDSAAQ
jgi:flagellar hook assembly protein FlgD